MSNKMINLPTGTEAFEHGQLIESVPYTLK
jgi:hypothetical protein